MGLDANQRTLVREFLKRGATVVELHRIGHGVPDLLIGYAGKDLTVEVKTEKQPSTNGRSVLRSTRCGGCGHDRRKHGVIGPRLPNHSVCIGGSKHEPCDCQRFKYDHGPRKRKPGGSVSPRQSNWALSWRGSPPEVVRDEGDVEAVLKKMEVG